MVDQPSVNEEAILQMGMDWTSPVGEIIRAATEHVVNAQTGMAPVSPIGSRYAPPGYLRSRIHAANPDHFDDEGRIMGLAGVAVNRSGGAWPYPLRFISMPSGRISNPYINRKTGRPLSNKPRTYRASANYFIRNALLSLEGWLFHTGDD